MIRIFGSVLILFLASSCTYDFTMTDRTKKKGDLKEVDNSFYMWGLAGNGSIPLHKYCKQGVYQVKDEQNIGQLLTTMVTIGIYQPRTVEISCAR